MGIDVTADGKVAFNDAHQNLLSTDVSRNPTRATKHGLVVQSVFQRRRSRDQKNDGNPLIYALKGKYGYTISRNEVRKFLAHFYAILEKCLAEADYDVIIPLPSSHPLNEIIARRVQRMLPEAELRSDCFEKKTVSQVVTEIDPTAMGSKKVRQAAKQLIHDLGEMPANRLFAMKNVNNHKLREHINPLSIVGNLDGYPNARVLLVDDLLSSGATMVGAHNLLKDMKNMSRIDGLCLFSSL